MSLLSCVEAAHSTESLSARQFPNIKYGQEFTGYPGKTGNFLLMFQVSPVVWRSLKNVAGQDLPEHLPSVISTFEKDPAVAAKQSFDRDTGKP